MDGRRIARCTAIRFDLPPDLQGRDGRRLPQLLSAAMAVDQDGDGATLYLLGRNGRLRAARVELRDSPYARVDLAPGDDWILVAGGNVAAVTRLGRTVLHLLAPTFDRPWDIDTTTVALPAPVDYSLRIARRGLEYDAAYRSVVVPLPTGDGPDAPRCCGGVDPGGLDLGRLGARELVW
jgi:hypothetical protein